MVGISLLELETFLVVAELKSFSLAAAQLNVTQPSVTSRVQKLEGMLGTRLLERTSRRVEVTSEGQRLFQSAQAALHDLRSLVSEFQQNARTSRQRVVVAATPVLAATLLPQLIREYQTRFRDVQVQILDLVYNDLLAAVKLARADVAISAHDENASDGLVVEPLYEDAIVVLVHKRHPWHRRKRLRVNELSRLDILMIEHLRTTRKKIEDALVGMGLPTPQFKTFALNQTLLGVLNAGDGIAVLPRNLAEMWERTEGHVILKIDDLELKRAYMLIRRRGMEPSAAARSFSDFLVTSLRKTHGT